MDKTFNFFKSKIKKQTQKTRNYSKSNSSKARGSKYSNKAKEQIPKITPLSQKEKQIRAAIEGRFQRSKLKNYRFEYDVLHKKREVSSSHSSDCQEYQYLKRLKLADIKQYHQKQQSLVNSEKCSKEKPNANLNSKLEKTSFRTESDEERKPLGHSSNALNKNKTPDSLSKNEKWRFINIKGKYDLCKSKNQKVEMKINSHRSCTVYEEPKIKTNTSLQKGLDKVKSKAANKLTLTRF